VATANYGIRSTAPITDSSAWINTDLSTLTPTVSCMVVKTSYGYDAATQNLEYVATTDWQGLPGSLVTITSSHFTDKLGRTARTVEDSGGIARVTTCGYDKAGHLTSQTAVNPSGGQNANDDQTTLYYFNFRGQSVKTLYSDSTYVLFTFDAWNGRAVSRTDQLGTQVSYSYAAVPLASGGSVYGRRQAEWVTTFGSSSVSTACAATATVTDGLGRMAAVVTYSDTPMQNQTTSVSRSYEWHGAVAAETEQLGGATSTSVLTVSYSYRSDETSPTGNQTTLRNIYYPYSGTTGDYMSVSSTANDVDALSRPTKMTWYRAANGTTTSVAAYAYAGAAIGTKTFNPDAANPIQHVLRSAAASNIDAWGRPTRDLVTLGGTNTLVDQQYAYDVAGNITWQYDAKMQSQAVNWSKSYQYDTLGRLATATRGSVSGWPGTATLSMTDSTWDWSGTSGGLSNLDKLGNWRQLSYGVPGNLLTDTRSHDAVNKVSVRTCANKVAPTWDANGNLTCDGDQTHTCGTPLHFVYDYRNRLVAASDDSGIPVTAYVYDGLNRRVEKQLYNAGAVLTDTWYVWSDWQCLSERNHLSSDAVIREYLYGVGYLDDHVALVTSTGAIAYYLQDRLHHVAAVVASTATQTTERYRYDPYGGLEIATNAGGLKSSSSVGAGFTFTGQYWDKDVGLYYYKNRWYSPDLGRFVTQDPSGYVDGMNLYQYVKSMPTMAGDLMGLYGLSDFGKDALGLAQGVGHGVVNTAGFLGGAAGSVVDAVTLEHTSVYNSVKGGVSVANSLIDGKSLSEAGQISKSIGEAPNSNTIKDFVGSLENNIDQRGGCNPTSILQGTLDTLPVTREVGDMAHMAINGTHVDGSPIQPGDYTKALGEGLVDLLAIKGAKALDAGAGPDATTPKAGGGASLDNISPGDTQRIQNAATRTGQEIHVVGSQAAGTAGPLSDWDYIVPNASSRTVHSLSSSLPEGPKLGIGTPRNQDFLPGPLDPAKPHVTFTPKPKEGE
jgi:RHS repeat-associated protein